MSIWLKSFRFSYLLTMIWNPIIFYYLLPCFLPNQFLKKEKFKGWCGPYAHLNTICVTVLIPISGNHPSPHALHYHHHQVRNRTHMHAEPTDHNMTCLMTRDKKHSLTKWPWTPVLISFQECLRPHCDCESDSHKAALLTKRQLLF